MIPFHLQPTQIDMEEEEYLCRSNSYCFGVLQYSPLVDTVLLVNSFGYVWISFVLMMYGPQAAFFTELLNAQIL